MASTESQSQRRRRRPDLNIDTTPPSTSHKAAVRESAPTTPPSKSKPPPLPLPSVSQHQPKGANHKSAAAARALAVPSTTHNAQDSFLDAATPVDADMSNKENDHPLYPRPRDSHDLSLPARQVTRDSLMTNMLMSLDQFSLTSSSAAGATTSSASAGAPFGTASSRTNVFDDSSPQAAYPYDIEGGGDSLARAIARQDRRNNSHGHAHAHGYSYSSDYDLADDSSRYSSQPSRGRRSNSSSNFQTNLGRINSMRESLRSNPGTSRHLHSRGGKGSKSSSTNSIDAGYVQVLGSQRWAHGFGGRSSSFDHGSQRPSLPHSNSQPVAPATGGWHIDFANTFLDDYDAAPTPTVPGGPRRFPPMTSPAAPTTIIPLPPPEPEFRESVLDHKRSSRSLKSTVTNRRTDAKHAAPAAQKAAAAPLLDLDSAPAPHVGYGKAKEPPVHAAPAPTQAASQPKERPGFFRRVFGGGLSRNNNASNSNADARNPSVAASANAVEPNDQASQSKSQSTPPSRDTSSSHSHHNVLQKKPSSFFRRRKKSIAEEVPPLPPAISNEPPMPPPAVAQFQIPPGMEKLSAKAEPSPVSSLRKVMSPYLKSSTSGPATPQRSPGPLQTETPMKPSTPLQPEDEDEAREYKRSFSPDYEPSPNAKIREVRPDPKEEDAPDGETRIATPTRPPPDVPKSSSKKSDCFLNLDGSDDNDADAELAAAKAAKDSSRTPSREPLAQPSVAVPSSSREANTERPSSADELQDDDLELDPRRETLILPIEGTKRTDSVISESTGTDYKSALQTPSVHVEDSSKVLGTYDAIKGKPLDEPEFVVGDPTDDDRQKAQRIFDGNEDFIQKEKAAAWMGEEGLVRQRTLRAYMELYDFTNKNVAYSLRQICERLILRAETQQVDRILVAFSKRWCDCNPKHGFKASDVIHTICYSIMLLNTDLHLADIEQKMTRSQFVKNVMTTIQQALAESAPDAFKRQSILPDKNGLLSSEDIRPSVDERSNRFSFKPPARRDPSADADGTYADDCGPLVKAPFDGPMRAWEAQVEIVLKDIYSSIRDEKLPLFGAEPSRNLNPGTQGGLSVMGMLKRTPSVLSKAPSEAQSSIRGRVNEPSRTGGNHRFVSKSRSRPRLNNGFSSSRTSFDDGNSIWSPATSSAAWSRYSLGRTQTSMSMDSFGKPIGGGEFQQSIGFANALSQAIIRDDASAVGAPSIMSDEGGHVPLLEDESLELAGPPWVKEGMVTHKHHLDGVERKAKDRNWHEVFAVVEKGQMSLFSFSANKSLGRKSKAARNAKKAPVLVGGGNWQDNATNLGTFSLRQTLASALPSPGYSRARPHVWALSLPTGAVHLFQVGTPEISKEFVTTANYWSARLSTHPLVGGISNIEYGWSDACINNALVSAINESTGSGPANGRTSRPGSSTNNHPPPASQGRTSMQSTRSFRSASFDYAVGSTGAYGGMGARGKLPGDRIHISEWSPPTQSMRPSTMPEHEQLTTLGAYVKGIEDELQAHNALRSPMLLAFTPRGANANKAMANWERKSAYLLREIVKFRTYVDCLQQAEARREEIYAERDLARRAARGDLSDGEVETDGDVTLRA